MKRVFSALALLSVFSSPAAALENAAAQTQIIACAFEAEKVRFSLDYPNGERGCEVRRRSDDGAEAQVIWRAREDADLCRRKLQSLTKILAENGWRCEGEAPRTSFLDLPAGS